jgi:hypothetical protein
MEYWKLESFMMVFLCVERGYKTLSINDAQTDRVVVAVDWRNTPGHHLMSDNRQSRKPDHRGGVGYAKKLAVTS